MLQVINKAKDAFKNKTAEMQAALAEATKSTEEVFNSVVSGLENAARGTTPSSPASSSPAASPVPMPKSTVVSSGNNTNTAPKPDSPAPAKKEGTPKAKRPPTTGEPLSSRDSIKMLQQEFSSRDPEEVFEVMEKLGEGASGAVYRATHKETKRLLAIKKYVPNSTIFACKYPLISLSPQNESWLEQCCSDRERNQNYERFELSLCPQVLWLLQKGRIHLGMLLARANIMDSSTDSRDIRLLWSTQMQVRCKIFWTSVRIKRRC